MRFLLVSGIVVAASAVALVRPDVGFMAYVWFSLMRPDLMAYAGPNSLSMILAVATLLGATRLVGRAATLLANPFAVIFLLFQVAIAISVYQSSYPSLVWPKYKAFLQMSVMAFLTPLLIRNSRQFRWLVFVMGFSIGFLGFKYGVIGVARGGMTFGYGEGGMHSDNNTLALGVAMGLPLCWYSVQLARQYPVKALFLVFSFLGIATIFMSHSRGGILTLVALLLVIGLQSRRKVAFLVLAGLLVVPSFWLVRDSVMARMETLNDLRDDQSAMNRLEAAKLAVRIIETHPYAGVGFGADAFRYAAYGINGLAEGRPIVAHDNWLQMWADSGVFAFLLFSGLLLGEVAWLWMLSRRLRHAPGDREDLLITQALFASLVAFVVGGTFLSRTNYDFIYLLLMAGVAWYQFQRSAARSMSDQEVFGAAGELTA